MAFQPVPETAEMVTRYTLQGIPVTNTFYARRTGGYTEQNLLDLAAAVDEWAGTQALTQMSNQCTYNETVVRGLANENDFEVHSALFSGVGVSANLPLPANVSLAVSRVSGLTGRSARGRVFWTGIPISALAANENFLSAAFVQNVEDVLNALRIIIEALQWIEVILSRYSNGVKRAECVTFPVVGYGATDERVDSQRGRLV